MTAGEGHEQGSRGISKRALRLGGSTVRRIQREATEMEDAGADIIHLEIGSPWFDTPRCIKSAAAEALDKGLVHYAPSRGIRSLRVAVSDKLAAYNGIQSNPDKEIIVTSGNKNATFLCLMALINDGDHVITFDPQYGPHRKQVELMGGVCDVVPLSGQEDWHIQRETLRASVTEATRAILLNNPLNPVGRVFTARELHEIAAVACDHDLWVITDETYEYHVYDGLQHVSIATLPGMRERTLSTFAFTKSYAMDGWRLGYLVGPAGAVDAVERVLQVDTSCANTFVQYGAVAAIREGAAVLADMVRSDQLARDATEAFLREVGLPCTHVEGTIYAFPDISRLGVTDGEMALMLLRDHRVATVPGSTYGRQGSGRIRLAFGAVPHERLMEAFRRMQDAIRSLDRQCPTPTHRDTGIDVRRGGKGARDAASTIASPESKEG